MGYWEINKLGEKKLLERIKKAGIYFLEDTTSGLCQSNFNGDPNVKRTCLPPPAVGQGTGRMAQFPHYFTTH